MRVVGLWGRWRWMWRRKWLGWRGRRWWCWMGWGSERGGRQAVAAGAGMASGLFRGCHWGRIFLDSFLLGLLLGLGLWARGHLWLRRGL